ncbi:hypothetical protein LguiA_031458 [Lonicera macranthoides]
MSFCSPPHVLSLNHAAQPLLITTSTSISTISKIHGHRHGLEPHQLTHHPWFAPNHTLPC